MQALTGCDALGVFANGLAPVRQHGRCGYIDKAGNWLIKPIFKDAQVFSEGLARVQHMPANAPTNAVSVVTKRGDILKQKFQNIGELKHGLIAASLVDHRLSPKSIRWGLIDSLGKWVMPPRYLEIGPLRGGMRYFRDGDLMGFMDKNGKIAIPAKFSQAGSFSEGLAPVCLQNPNTLVFIDQAGKVVLSRNLKDPVRITDEWPTFRQGLCAMYQGYKTESRWGFIDRENHWKIKPIFKEVKSFSGRYAVAGIKIK